MGAALVKKTYAYAARVPLNPNEFRLLAFMAVTALDTDDVPRYFDSRESSALALGRLIVDEGQGDHADQRARSAALEAVKVAIRGLVALGAIKTRVSGKTGRRAEYEVVVDMGKTMTSSEYLKRRSALASKEGPTFRAKKAQPSEQRRLSLLTGEGSTFPQGGRQEDRGQKPGDTSPDATTSPEPVEKIRAIS